MTTDNGPSGLMELVDRIRDLEVQNQFLRSANEQLTVQFDQLMEQVMPQDFSGGRTRDGRGFILPAGWLKKIRARIQPADLRFFGPTEAEKRLRTEMIQVLTDHIWGMMLGHLSLDSSTSFKPDKPCPALTIYIMARPDRDQHDQLDPPVKFIPDKDTIVD